MSISLIPFGNFKQLSVLGVDNVHFKVTYKEGHRIYNPTVTYSNRDVGFVIITTMGMHIGRCSVFLLSYYDNPIPIYYDVDSRDANFSVSTTNKSFTINEEHWISFLFIGFK